METRSAVGNEDTGFLLGRSTRCTKQKARAGQVGALSTPSPPGPVSLRGEVEAHGEPQTLGACGDVPVVHVPNQQGELVQPQEATTELWCQERDRPTNISEVETAGLGD